MYVLRKYVSVYTATSRKHNNFLHKMRFMRITINCTKKDDSEMSLNQTAIDRIKKRFTNQDADIVAQRATNNPSIKVSEYSLNPYSTDFLGGLGSYWNLRITTKDPKIELTFFLKSIPLEAKKSLDDFMKECQVFKEEAEFFEKIYPVLTENYCGDEWSCTCYLIKKDVLVMEDLRLKGYKLQERIFDKTDNLKAGLKTVAHFHSCSILAEARLKKPLNKQFPDSFIEKIYARSGFPRAWQLSSLNVTVAVAKSLSRDPEKIRERFESIYDMAKPSSKYRNVLCHGDLWVNNMMFDDKSKCILVDFQTITYVPLVLDILKFLYLNTTREYRDKNEKKLIEYYHSVLEETIKRNDATKKIKIPTVDDVLGAYDDLRLFGVISACLYFPDILIDFIVYKDPSKKEDLWDGNKVGIVLAAMEKDPFFKCRMNEVVTEFAEFSENIRKK